MKKGWIAVIIGLVVFCQSATAGTVPADLEDQQRILVSIGKLLLSRHYSPRKIDDALSREVWQGYLDKLDPEKRFFLKSDIDQLQGYSTLLDEEIQGIGPLQFMPYTVEVFSVRLEKVRLLYGELLSKPFILSEKEGTWEAGTAYLADETIQRAYSRKYLKYLVLQKFAFLREERANSRKGDPLFGRSDLELEKTAREKVARQLDWKFTKMKSDLDESKQFDEYVNVIMHCMDPHSDYFPPVKNQAFMDGMSNRLTGIGIELREVDGLPRIDGIEPGGPAAQSGVLQVNDRILEVGQGADSEMVDISGLPIRDVTGLISGPKGTTVRLTLRKQNGSIQSISLVRDEIIEKEGFVQSAVIREGQRRIGYILLPKFYADFSRPDGVRCSADMARAVSALKASKVDGIVLDLRFNGGGSLQEVIKIVGLFIKTGPVVQVRTRDTTVVLEDKDSSLLYDGPLTVMVNEYSASASEICTAAIQDYHRGLVIGSSATYGKGTVQVALPLGLREDGALKLTTEKFYRINGGSTQLKGVTPDVILPDLGAFQKIREADNPSALPWDQVAKADYTLWSARTDARDLIEEEDRIIAQDTVFGAIRQIARLIEDDAYKKKALDWSGYAYQEKSRQQLVDRAQRLQKLPPGREMEVQPVGDDQTDIYRKWISQLKTDIYIREAARVCR